jgi:uncharacterized protein YjiS (DUF1127 family)
MAYLIRATFDWLDGRVRRRGRRIPLELDDHTLRDIGITRAEYHFLAMSGPSSAPGAGDGARMSGAGVGCNDDYKTAGIFTISRRLLAIFQA